jgi:hypothetical protein
MEFTPPLLRAVEPIGLYFRPGRNDHTALLQALAIGGPGFTGAVLDASLAARHGDLLADLKQRRMRAVLDPMVMELATAGGWERKALQTLPWAGSTMHTPETFDSVAVADAIAQFVTEKDYSAVLAPTHYVNGVDEPWWRTDRASTRELRHRLDAAGHTDLPIYYRLAIPRRALMDTDQRRAIVAHLSQLDVDAVWLCVHPVSANASASILKSYLEFCRDLQSIGIALVAERTGSLGLTLLGFNAVGGVESGVTLGEGFDANRLIRPPARRLDGVAFSPAPRVYIEQLGIFMDKDAARAFFGARGMRRRFACQDRPCCRTPEDMIRDPRRHFLYTKAQQVVRLGRVPPHNRPTVHLDAIRQASDDAMHAARVDKKFEAEQRRLGDWRLMLAGVVERNEYARSVVANTGIRRRSRARSA